MGNRLARFEITLAVACVGTILAVPGTPLLGQAPGLESRYAALTDLSEVAPSAAVEWDMGITMRGGPTRGEFEDDLEGTFVGGLEVAGVTTAGSALGRLECSVRLTLLEGMEPAVTVFWTVRVLRPEDADQPTGSWQVVWSAGEVRTVDRDALSGSVVAFDCAAAFRRDWSRANPGRERLTG